MVNRPDSKKARQKRHTRVRAKISGTAECPRLNVFRSLQHIYAQIIDDVSGKTLVSASTVEKDFEDYGGNKSAARKVGITLAKRAAEYLTASVAPDQSFFTRISNIVFHSISFNGTSASRTMEMTASLELTISFSLKSS